MAPIKVKVGAMCQVDEERNNSAFKRFVNELTYPSST